MKLKDTTVLVVDDEPMLLDIFRDWLQEEDCHVWTAGDGAAALQILRDNHVDVIVSDVRMPVMDGVALVKKLPMSSPNQYLETLIHCLLPKPWCLSVSS